MPEIVLIANGDLRLAANRVCWDAQKQTEEAVMNAIRREGHSVRRGHPFDPGKGHGFIDSQIHGLQVFRNIPEDAPIVVVEAVWQYTQHILGGLISHKGPIMTIANWSGQWPGLVGMLNLNGSLTKAGVQYSTLWSVDFTDEAFRNGVRQWLSTGKVEHDLCHVHPLTSKTEPKNARQKSEELAATLQREKAIMG